MNIWELEEYAKEHGFNSLRFEFIGLHGRPVRAKWLDAYYGFLVLDGHDGFITSKQLIKFGLADANYRVIEDDPDPLP